MRILYVGSYKSSYSRNRILIDGLRANGVEVAECNEPRAGWLTYVRLGIRLLRLRGTYDVMLVGFPGQEAMFVARLCASAPIVFDVFTSHYMGYIMDRQYFAPGSLRARYYWFLDYWSCRLADLIILDTQAHINFFVREFGLPQEKFLKIFLGAKTDMYHPRERQKNNDMFTVLFWGSFIPLQGTEYIVAAAQILRNEPIRFVMAGEGMNRQRDIAEAERQGLTNVHFPGKISDDALIDYITQADICLGALSGNAKADITIQNKIFETIASQRPILTSRTKALEELLTDRVNCLLCNPADAQDLADKILLLMQDPGLRSKIADNGYRFFQERLSEKYLGQEFMIGVQDHLRKARKH